MFFCDIVKIKSSDTFIRPIYAGNALATVKSNDKKKCITIRPTSFDPAPSSGESASEKLKKGTLVEKVESVAVPNISKFIKEKKQNLKDLN